MSNFICLVVAVLLSAAVIQFANKFGKYLGTINTAQELILFCELGVMILMFTAFGLKEFIILVRRFVNLMHGKDSKLFHDTEAVLLLFGSIIVSLALYTVFTKLNA